MIGHRRAHTSKLSIFTPLDSCSKFWGDWIISRIKPVKLPCRELSNEPKYVQKLQKEAKRAFLSALCLRSQNCAARERKTMQMECWQKCAFRFLLGVFRRSWAHWKDLDELIWLVWCGKLLLWLLMREPITPTFTTWGQRGENEQLWGVHAAVPNHISAWGPGNS